ALTAAGGGVEAEIGGERQGDDREERLEGQVDPEAVLDDQDRRDVSERGAPAQPDEPGQVDAVARLHGSLARRRGDVLEAPLGGAAVGEPTPRSGRVAR